MKLPKNKHIDLPLYLRTKELIKDQILSEKLQPGQKVPSENNIVDQLGVSRMTANRALRELVSEGYLKRIQGVGTFVADKRPQGAMLSINSISEEISAWGGVHHCDVILQREEVASRELADTLAVCQGARVFHTILLHWDRDIPILHADRYVNPAVAPEYLKQDFKKITPTEYLISVAPLEEASHTVEAVIPGTKIRKRLQIQPCEPCLLLHRKTWSFGVVATKSQLVYPASRYSLSGRFKSGPISLSILP